MFKKKVELGVVGMRSIKHETRGGGGNKRGGQKKAMELTRIFTENNKMQANDISN